MSWSRAIINGTFLKPLAAQTRLLSTTVVRRCDGEKKDSPSVLVDKNEEFKVMTISLNRASKRNCVNKETAEKLYEAFEDFENDSDVNVAILHGIGGNFCAGYDLDELAKLDRENIANEIVCSFSTLPFWITSPLHTGAKILNLSKNSPFEKLTFDKNHVL